MSQVLCPTCNEPQREQFYQLEPFDGPPTNSIGADDECSSSSSSSSSSSNKSHDRLEAEETSTTQTSNSTSEHEEIVRELEQQIINLKMDLAEEKDRNGHLAKAKVDIERELSQAQKSHGALLVESTKHKFDAQNATRENASLRAENERLHAEMKDIKKQRLHAGMVNASDQDPHPSTNPDLNASDGSLGDMLKDLFAPDKRRRSTASTAASSTAATISSACPRPTFHRANSGGFFRDLAADIERRRSSLPGRPVASTPDLQSAMTTVGRRSSTSDAPSKAVSATQPATSGSTRSKRPSRRASLLMNQRNYQSDFALCSTTSDDQEMAILQDQPQEERAHEHAPSMLHVVGKTTWGKLKD